MTLDELERTLPNGLHDAELIGLQVDYSARRAVLDVNIDVSDANDPTESEENYGTARIIFSGVQFVVIDPPAGDSRYAGLPMIDTGEGQPRTAPRDLPPIAEECFLCWIFVSQWNSFIRVSAQSVGLEWSS